MHLFYYLLPEEISSFRERETRPSCDWHKRLYESPVLIMQVICMRRKYPYTNVLSSEELLHIRARTHKHAAWTRFRIIAAATLSAQEVIRRTIDFWERIYRQTYLQRARKKSTFDTATAPKFFRIRSASEGLKM